MEHKKPWLEFAGAISVVASLIFVGLEIRQNTVATRGATYQAISDASIEHVRWYASDKQLRQLVSRVSEGETRKDFSREENILIGADYLMTIRRMENVYVQVREGLVGEEAVARFRPGKGKFEKPWFRDFWKEYRLQMEPAFLEYFESEFLSQPISPVER